MTSDTTSPRPSIGDLIRQARLRSGVSQRALARRAGTSQAAISRIERGLEQPTFERAQQILAGLGWRVEFELEPLAEYDAEPRRIHESMRSLPSERTEQGVAWMQVADELLGAGRG